MSERQICEEERLKAERVRQLWQELKTLRATMLRSDWHAGFEAILRLDIHEYGQRVRLMTEEVLGEEPPRADFIVLVEEPGLRMKKEIFRDFLTYNILEYKNPHDGLNESVLRKAVGYANLYTAIEGVDAEQVTITSFAQERTRGCLIG